MRLGQMHIALCGAQIRMSHQLGHAEYIDARFDRACAIGVPQIIEAKRRLNSAIPQCPEMRGLQLSHWPIPVVAIAHPARKEVIAFGLREPPPENREHS